MKKCFVICPIGDEESSQRKRSNQVLKHIISPICNELGFDVVRVDQIHAVDKIDNTILEYLSTAELVIADLTDYNPNVFYELGYRHALGKPMIPIIELGTSIPFDLSSIRTISYVTNDLDKVEEVKSRLRETIIALNIQENSSEEHYQDENSVGINPIPYLLNITDELTEIKSLIKSNNDELVEKIFNLSMNKIKENSASVEDRAMDRFFDVIINNPSKLDSFLKIAKKFENYK